MGDGKEHEPTTGMMIIGASMMLRRRADANKYMSEIHQITGQNGWILGYLSEQERLGTPVYQRDLEENFSLTRSAVSRLVGGMEGKGLIRRESVAGDARLKRILLTDYGRQVEVGAERERRRLDEMVVQGLDEEEIRAFKAVLKKIMANIKNP